MQPSNFEDTLEQTTEELIEQLVELLLNIANEVFISRPLCIKRFLADYLLSRIDKKTLWHMQMEGFLNDNSIKSSDNAFNEYKGCCHSNGTDRESCSHSKDSYLSHLLQKKAAMEHETSDEDNLKNMAASEDQSGLANYNAVAGSDCKLENSESHAIITDRDINFLLKELANGIDSMSNRGTDVKFKSPNVAVSDKIFVGSSNVTRLKKYFLANSSSETSKQSNNEDVPDFNNSYDKNAAYDKVASSINRLIDIEKDFKKCGSEYGVYKYLKKKQENRNDANDVDATGIVECSCLKPSLFRKRAGKKILNLDKKLTNQCRSDNPIEDTSINMTSFVITGRPICSNEMKTLDSTSTNVWKQQIGGHATMEKELSVISDNSSTSISSTYEYNKHIASSSTECLLGHLMRNKKDMPSTKSSTSPKSSLSSDKEFAAASKESKQKEKNISNEEDIRAPNGDTRGKHMGQEGSINTRLLSKNHQFPSDVQDTLQLVKTPSSLKHISLYRCPEQCDFFKTDDIYNDIPYRFAEPLGVRNTCERRLKKNLSDTDARMPDWAEYCLGLPPLSVSAHLLNTIKSNVKEKMPSLDTFEIFNECSPKSSNIGYLAGESNTLYNGAGKDSHKSILCCLSRKPFNETDISIDNGEVSYNSEGTELILSQEGKGVCSELRSMPCPSLYYHTTWLDSTCSLEASEDVSQWKKPCNENTDNNSSRNMGISQGWISIDEDIFSGCTLFKNDHSLNPCGNNNHALEYKEIMDVLPTPCQRNNSTRNGRGIPRKKRRYSSVDTARSSHKGDDYIITTSFQSTPKSQFGHIQPVRPKQSGSNFKSGKANDMLKDSTEVIQKCQGKMFTSSSNHDVHPFSMWHTFNVFEETGFPETRMIAVDDTNSGDDVLLLYETDL